MNVDAEPLFYLLIIGHWYSFFCEGSIPIFFHLKGIGSIVFLLLSCKSSLCVWGTSPTSDICTAHIFSQSVVC